MLKLRNAMQEFTIQRDHKVADKQSTLGCRARWLEVHDEQNLVCILGNLRTYALGHWYRLHT
jgi:hypothetical protein